MRFVNHGDEPIEIRFPDGWHPQGAVVYPGRANAIVIAHDWDEEQTATDFITALCATGLHPEPGGNDLHPRHMVHGTAHSRGAWIHDHATRHLELHDEWIADLGITA